jgi:Ni,Fe-hydrogenase III large subunit/Ni,Fe-hydrogenase III component G
MMKEILIRIQEICRGEVLELHRRSPRERHFVIARGDDLQNLCRWAQEQNRAPDADPANSYYLATALINDERFLEDHCFKLYLVLLAPAGMVVVLEHPLIDPDSCPSLRESFAAITLLEREMRDLFQIVPGQHSGEASLLLYSPYPESLGPLRRSRGIQRLRQDIAKHAPTALRGLVHLLGDRQYLQVGPVHKDLIESGGLRFQIAGERIEAVELQIGYKHRGIEKLFEVSCSLVSGVKLAERVVGDAAFAHGLAYCRAVEALAGIALPERAALWRELLLELERIANHLLVSEKILHDVALDLVASELADLRERVMRLNEGLSGHRLLRGVNQPGGVSLSHERLPEGALRELRQICARYLTLCEIALKNQYCRDQLLQCGKLSQARAWALGATGPILRATGVVDHDVRLRHPEQSARFDPAAELVEATARVLGGRGGFSIDLPLADALDGDAYARILLRVLEVPTSLQLIERCAEQLVAASPHALSEAAVEEALRQAPNFEFGLGFAESHRGDL